MLTPAFDELGTVFVACVRSMEDIDSIWLMEHCGSSFSFYQNYALIDSSTVIAETMSL
jgi:hypothetical protein